MIASPQFSDAYRIYSADLHSYMNIVSANRRLFDFDKSEVGEIIKQCNLPNTDRVDYRSLIASSKDESS